MKRALIIASAGCSSRFSRSVGRDVLKVLYYEDDKTEECLLADQLTLVRDAGFDSIVIVGGYAYEELRDFIARYYSEDQRIETVYNEKFHEHGTCYSFACGLNTLRGRELDEIVFMEGDLIVDAASFSAIVDADSDVVTANRELIRADTAVVFYTTTHGKLHYVYDTQHRALRIDETFTRLGNSGQVWKFRDVGLLHETVDALGDGLYDDTNLLPITNYFNARGLDRVIFISFNIWFNCNTIDDYRAIRRYKENRYE